MKYATKIKMAVASALCVMVGMGYAYTVDTEVPIYGATFESAKDGVVNDYDYTNGHSITEYTNQVAVGTDAIGTIGWFAGSEDDESVITNLQDGVQGQVLRLNTEAEILTNKLSTANANAVKAALTIDAAHSDDSYNSGDSIGTYQGTVFESDVKFVASDTLDPGITGGTDATKFAIYAYCDDSTDGNPTNLVVYHAFNDNGTPAYTNEVFSNVNIDCSVFTHLRIEMKKYTFDDYDFNVFSVAVNDGEPLSSPTAFNAAAEGLGSGIWFLTTEILNDENYADVASLNFKGTGEIDNIKISQKVQETYAAIVDGIKYASWSTAAAAAIAGDKTLESYTAGQSIELAAETHIAVTNEQPTVTTVSGYKVVTSGPVDGVYTYTSVLDKATVLFVAYNGDILYSNDFTIGTAPSYVGADPTKPADASGVYTWTGWTSGGVDYGTSDALAKVVVGGATYTATFSSVASVASVNGQYYATLTEAIANATSGQTITLCNDVTLTSSLVFPAGMTNTLDLAGNKIEGNLDPVIVNNGNLTITDSSDPSTGKVKGISCVKTCTGSTTVFNGGTFEGEDGCIWSGKSNNYSVTINDGTFSATQNAVLMGNGQAGCGVNSTWTINGGTFNGSMDAGGVALNYIACGIYAPDSAIWTINAGTFNITNGVGIVARAGSVDIPSTSTVVINTTGDVVGKVGDSNIVVPSAAIVFDSRSGYPEKANGDQIAVAGGTFNSASGVDAVQFVNADSDTNQRVAVSGGAFSSVVDEELCAPGFIPVTEPNGDGKYEVTPGGTVTFVNYDGTELYKTNVANGGTAVYGGATPVKPSDASGVYTFSGWDPATIVAVNSADQTYTAQFSKSGDAKATVISVAGTVTNFYPSLKAAVAAASAGDTVTLLADDDVSLTDGSQLLIDKAITIDGNGYTVYGKSAWTAAEINAVRDGKAADPTLVHCVKVDGSANVTIKNVALTEFADATYLNAGCAWAIFAPDTYTGNLTLDNVQIDKFNRTAVDIRGSGTYEIKDCTITCNAENMGTSFDIFQQPVQIGGTAAGTITGTTISNVNCSFAAGTGNNPNGILVWSEASAIVTNSTITGGTSNDGTVGIWVQGSATATVYDTTVDTDYVAVSFTANGVDIESGDFSGELYGNAGNIVVNGGTFDQQVPDKFAGTGLWPTVEREGKYTVDIKRTVTFTVDGATYATEYVADGDPVAAPATDPTKANYVFTGWTLSGAAYDFATPVTGDITLVAAFGDAKATVISVAGTVTNVVGYYASLADAIHAADDGDTVVLLANETADATKTTAADRLVVTNAITIDFGPYTYSVPGSLEPTANWCALFIDADTVVKGTTGGIDCLNEEDPSDPCGVYAFNVRNNAKLTIEGGMYHGGGTVIQAQLGTVEINGGTFSVTPYGAPYGYDFALNCVDSNYQAGNAGFEINGGTFVGFDPQDIAAEGEHTDFTDDGFVAIDDGNGNWVVQEGYNVTFDADGGTPAPAAQRVAAGDPATAPTEPTKASDGEYNYTFSAWQLNGADYDFVDPIAADCTLVAVYDATPISTAITFPNSDDEIPAGALLDWIEEQGYDQDDVNAAGTTEKLTECYLLNCTPGTGNGGTLSITAIQVVGSEVRVTVKLERTGAIGAINGTLYVSGTAALGGTFADVASVTFSDADFSEGDTTTAAFTDGTKKFFKAVIK